MVADSDLRQVLAAYPSDCQPKTVQNLGAGGGFSGARLWRLETSRGPLCLRRWPEEHPSREGLEFIQAVLRHVTSEGFALVLGPLDTQQGAGYVEHDRHLWELTRWMPGEANYRQVPS